MVEAFPADYLAGLPGPQRQQLEQVNRVGLAALREYLGSGQAVAFLGAGVSAPLYPLWDELIGELVDAAAESGQLDEGDAATCREMARRSPEEVVEILRQRLGVVNYGEVLRHALRGRTDPETGRSWTPVQELVCRCAFKAVVTTNYDPGILDARIRVRPGASATGFTTWEDELGLYAWRTGDVFGGEELPVLYAHGQHNRPDSVVLATTEYRRAYAGKLPEVLARLLDGHLVWLGFSFTDQRIVSILREVGDRTGTRIDPGVALRHVAVMAWDPDAAGNAPTMLARRAEIAYGTRVVLYPAPGRDHSALARLLAGFTDDRFAPAVGGPVRASAVIATRSSAAAPDAGPTVAVRWMTEPERAEHFVGRQEELARLDRWAADPQVALVGLTAWGGAGKTALVTHWADTGGADRRPGLRGAFGWSFYADPSADHWAHELLDWASRELGVRSAAPGRPARAVRALLQKVPVLLLLDGLERVQEGPAGEGFGRLLDGTLREVLASACQEPGGSLIVLTSRFPFADLEPFDGSSARILEIPPFTLAEGSALLAAAGGGWLHDDERRELTRAVDGHALAVTALAGLLADQPPASYLGDLRDSLAAAVGTDARVRRVLEFYAARLAEADRDLLAVLSLFARPVGPDAVLAVAAHRAFGSHLAHWAPADVKWAVRDRLAGLATCHSDGTISAHPLVRDTFRPLALDAARTAARISLAGLPAGKVTTQAEALRLVEAIELLLDAGQYEAAHDLYINRTGEYGNRPGVSSVWKNLPAARLGQRAATAFVANPARRAACATQISSGAMTFYLAQVALFAMLAGDLVTALEYVPLSIRRRRDSGNAAYLSADLLNQAECLGQLGRLGPAQAAAAEALSCAEAAGAPEQILGGHGYLGWLAGLSGDSALAEEEFMAADEICVAGSPDGGHQYSVHGVRWAEWLARTARPDSAAVLTDHNTEVSRRNRWHDDVARCNRMLGNLALAAGDSAEAGRQLSAAADAFRDGDFLAELAATLPDLAGSALDSGDLQAADRYATEAIAIAAPRGLIAAQAAGLAVRARIRAAQATATGGQDPLYQGRDAADAVCRLAARHHLAWSELDGLRAHAALDQAEGIDHGHADQADELYDRLMPSNLHVDPLATVDRRVARQIAAALSELEDY